MKKMDRLWNRESIDFNRIQFVINAIYRWFTRFSIKIKDLHVFMPKALKNTKYNPQN
jgi:hypothetical protein